MPAPAKRRPATKAKKSAKPRLVRSGGNDTLAADRRKQILRAAVRVFAERGFHKTRVSDIAAQAGVAYGLIYHYFGSKDAVLEAVFQDNWSVFLKVLRDIASTPDKDAGDKLRAIVDLLIDALRIEPQLVQVLIQEVLRTDRFVQPGKVGAFHEAFGVVRGIIEDGQAHGEIRKAVDPQVGAFVFFGAIETVCTGFLLRAIPCATEADATTIKRSLSSALLTGMVESR